MSIPVVRVTKPRVHLRLYKIAWFPTGLRFGHGYQVWYPYPWQVYPGVRAGREGQGEGYTSNGTTRTMVCVVPSLLYLSGRAWDAQGHRDCCVWRTRTRVCEGVAISIMMSALSQSLPNVGEDEAWAVVVVASSGQGIWRGGGRGRQQGCVVVVVVALSGRVANPCLRWVSLSLSRCRGTSPILT